MTTIENRSLFSRMILWVNERFPLTNIPLFFILWFLSFSVALPAQESSSQVKIALGGLLSLSFFLLLRVLDEHKDYADDCLHHPQRVLQQGIISLTHLKFLGALCMLVQLGGIALLSDGEPQIWLSWGLLLCWTLLMSKEFFVDEWLKQHFSLYALSHTLVMPFVIGWLATLASPAATLNLPLILLMLLAFLCGLSFEITRKCKGADEDREEVTSWSQLYGRPRSVVMIIGLLILMVIVQYFLILCKTGAVSIWFYAVSAFINFFTISQLLIFLINANQQNRKRNEAMVGMAMLTGYLLCIVEIYL
ncbi:UbiA family prenyltransferase [Kosakonia sp. S58]|uniref:UbiA family prenyltransferase n=1 Tax=unclassified Kosakonia TaxID=2632876 RepID=UPI0019042E65|nr:MULTISPECIES: UbiA family prenyltransferase [unclassified Kosakonia]MBK0080439.1 UbiA family prenyltransferase [Kosakonia sp. S57]MBK0087237.1 UbiA family prenyltransferase [Kosakonia sp. S58]